MRIHQGIFISRGSFRKNFVQEGETFEQLRFSLSLSLSTQTIESTV